MLQEACCPVCEKYIGTGIHGHYKACQRKQEAK